MKIAQRATTLKATLKGVVLGALHRCARLAAMVGRPVPRPPRRVEDNAPYQRVRIRRVGDNAPYQRCARLAAAVAAAMLLSTNVFALEEAEWREHVTWTGGEPKVEIVDGEMVLSFTNTAAATDLKVDCVAKARILAVGGGGSGGAYSYRSGPAGGGGGGGGVVYVGRMIFDTNTTYKITVGAGGAAASSSGTEGKDGGDSSIETNGVVEVLALGGGGGGANSVGRPGGNGGGTSLQNNDGGSSTQSTNGKPKASEEISATHYGNAGGACGGYNRASGGGGGAGAIGGTGGEDLAVSGAGGVGATFNIAGKETIYGGGGGGGAYGNVSTFGAGGAGGGGSGGSGKSEPENGTDGLGGGGGGGLALSGKGGDGIVIVRIEAILSGGTTIDKPSATNFVYNGSLQSPLPEGYIDFVGMTNAIPGQGAPVFSATDAGEYSYTFALYSGFKFSDDSGNDHINVFWSISQAPNSIKNLSLANWKEGADAPDPQCETDFGEPVYAYAAYEEGVKPENAKYESAKPTTAGEYWVRAQVAETANYAGTDMIYARFTVRAAGVSPIPALGRFAECYFTNYTGEAKTDYPVLVKIANNKPEGFDYSQAEPDGSDIRFTDAAGNVLSHVVYTNASNVSGWNPPYQSVFAVLVPEFSKDSVITMCWGVLDGKEDEVPAAGTDDVYATYGRTSDELTNQNKGTGIGTFDIAGAGTGLIDANAFKNRWVDLPAISTNEWKVGEAGATVVTNGSSVGGGEITVRYRGYGMAQEEGVEAQPTEAGYYEAVFRVAPAGGYAALDHAVGFEIVGETEYSDLSGGAATVSASGRVLLMNNDAARTNAPAVTYQGYVNTNTNNPTFWTTLAADSISQLNLKGGTEFMLRKNGQTGAERLWHLVNCRHGNTFPESNSTSLSEDQCYLPWSPTSRSINSTSSTGVGGNRINVGQCVMRNTPGAGTYASSGAYVVSPCYEEGVGTIYFDAVNGWTEWFGVESTGEAATTNVFYALALEWTTNCYGVATNGDSVSVPPTDANLLDTSYFPTNYYAHDVEWHAAEMTPYLISNGTMKAAAATTNLVLDIASGGSTGVFYRVVAKLDRREPVRFRIRRTAYDTRSTQGKDSSFILLDNVIASHPAMRVDLEHFGKYDESRDGKRTLGAEAAWSVPFPSATDEEIYARAKPVYYTNSLTGVANGASMVSKALMHYRWRYLNQATNEWRTAVLNHRGDYSSQTKLDFSPYEGIEGDVEFFYELNLRAPHYVYVDYSGLGIGVKDGDAPYSENIPVVTNRCAAGNVQQTCGSDWFVRLRQGRSAYEDVVFTAILSDAKDLSAAKRVETNTVHLAVTGDNTWRGYFRTLPKTNAYDNAYAWVTYRLVASNRQEAAATEWATNAVFWKARDDVDAMPVSGTMTVCGEDEWSKMPYSWETGYYMIQANDLDEAMYLSIVQADYQNFNAWHDARTTGHKFVGNAIVGETTNTTGTASGASSQSQDFHENFDAWTAMPAGNSHWNENFGESNIDGGIPGFPDYYQEFDTGTTENGWSLAHGLGVFGRYRDKDSGMAFEMAGQGKGSVKFIDSTLSPRGLEKISFNARIATIPVFDNFAYYMSGDASAMSNYTVHARVAFDRQNMKGFLGNGSVSLVAYMHPGKGCYEFRVEQAQTNSVSGTGANKKEYCNGQVFYLKRWRYNGGKMIETNLWVATNRSYATTDKALEWDRPTGGTNAHNNVFLSVLNTNGNVLIEAGIGRGTVKATQDATMASLSGQDYSYIGYLDTSNDRLDSGMAAFGAANCPAYIMQPRMLAGNVAPMHVTNAWKGSALSIPANDYRVLLGEVEVELGDGTVVTGRTYRTMNFFNSLRENSGAAKDWAMPPGLMEAYETTKDGNDWGLRAIVPTNTVGVYVTDAGKDTGWMLVGKTNVSSFASVESFSFTPYRTPDTSFMVKTMDSKDDPRVDVVVDDFSITQWRGTDWNDSLELTGKIPGYIQETDANSRHTNFVFTTAWIKSHNGKMSLLMSAKRTNPASATSSTTPSGSTLRSPFMDGYRFSDGRTRGSGLGMFAFSWRDAHEKAKLVLEVATNDTDFVNIANVDYNDSAWQKFTTDDFDGTIDFSAMTETERASGSRSIYLGLHGVKGAMRLRMDDQTVVDAANSSDPEYGQVYITDVFCRDEPALDSSSWWGWNLRTPSTDIADKTSDEDFARLMLSDKAADGENKGMSLALNNSITADVYKSGDATYEMHVPFLQTPVLSSNIVGEVSVRARKYDASGKQPALISLYGSKDGSPNGKWHYVGCIVVSNAFYQTYTFKAADLDANYKSFRFAVAGVPGAAADEFDVVNFPNSTNASGSVVYPYSSPVRVLLDEASVSQTMRAKVGFRNTGAFRNQALDAALNYTEAAKNFPGPLWQPLCGEDFGIQCEIYPKQLPEEIDFSKGLKVHLYWYFGDDPWGFDNWATNRYCHHATLAPASDSNLVFKSSHLLARDAIIPEVCNTAAGAAATSGSVVQYMLAVEWYPAGEGGPFTTPLEASDWVNPPWYAPVDKNAGKDAFSAYTILDTVAPGWAWINEVNLFGGFANGYDNKDSDCQFVEVAVPVESDITGWTVRYLEAYPGSETIYTNEFATFGAEAPARKSGNVGAASNMVFRVLGSNKSYFGRRLKYDDGTLDGVWKVRTDGEKPPLLTANSGEVYWSQPVGLQLVRASGVVEHEIVLRGFTFDEDSHSSLNPTNHVAYYNRQAAGARFYYIGKDWSGDAEGKAAANPAAATNSLSVLTREDDGVYSNNWSNAVGMTPGRINIGQYKKLFSHCNSIINNLICFIQAIH